MTSDQFYETPESGSGDSLNHGQKDGEAKILPGDDRSEENLVAVKKRFISMMSR